MQERFDTFSEPISILKVTKINILVYDNVFNWGKDAALLRGTGHCLDEVGCFLLLVFAVLQELVGNHEGVVLTFLY
jgi:hypothetical protein